ncbi:MAG: hypothetical protein KDA90_10245 [Planctomycetaceae bacterium]|nr:hypothetical protein [Planctomycetaceae bacterium]
MISSLMQQGFALSSQQLEMQLSPPRHGAAQVISPGQQLLLSQVTGALHVTSPLIQAGAAQPGSQHVCWRQGAAQALPGTQQP